MKCSTNPELSRWHFDILQLVGYLVKITSIQKRIFHILKWSPYTFLICILFFDFIVVSRKVYGILLILIPFSYRLHLLGFTIKHIALHSSSWLFCLTGSSGCPCISMVMSSIIKYCSSYIQRNCIKKKTKYYLVRSRQKLKIWQLNNK